MVFFEDAPIWTFGASAVSKIIISLITDTESLLFEGNIEMTEATSYNVGLTPQFFHTEESVLGQKDGRCSQCLE